MNAGKIKIITVLVITALALSGSALYAFPPDDQCPPPQGGKWDKARMEECRKALYKDLNLSADQQKALEMNKAKNREEMKSLFEQMKAKKDAMRQELQQSALNMGKVTQLNNDLKILEAQMLDHRLAGILEVRKILTPEQFKKFMEKMDERPKHFKRK